jgi:peptidylprolyl isomerase
MRASIAVCHWLLFACMAATASDQKPEKPTMSGVLESSNAADWRAPSPENLVLMELASGSVLLELAPDFAPAHAANIRTLVRQRYFDGLQVLRAQDNYVVQWGDPNADQPGKRRSIGEAAAALPGEFDRAMADAPSFTALPDPDSYAPETGFVAGFPAARNAKTGRLWMTHCYAALGVSRDNAADSGNGAGLYVVIGHAPRHLDRNITLVGRVLQGMELLSTMPRGTGTLGFYQGNEHGAALQRLRIVADLPEAERPSIEVMRTDTARFSELIQARRSRHESWFHEPTGRIELCNVPVPVRAVGREQ